MQEDIVGLAAQHHLKHAHFQFCFLVQCDLTKQWIVEGPCSGAGKAQGRVSSITSKDNETK